MSQQTATAPVEETEELLDKDKRFLHCFCLICAMDSDIAVSMCGAKTKPVAELMGASDMEGPRCVVCDELSRKVCKGCGF